MRMSNKPVTPERKRSGFEILLLCIVIFLAAISRAQESRSSGWVVIPVAEYRTLHAKAYPVEPELETPPVQATLTRVDYDLQVRGDLAKGRASLTIDVLKDGWVRVPIPSGLLVREARLDNKLVSLVPELRAHRFNSCAWAWTFKLPADSCRRSQSPPTKASGLPTARATSR